MYIMILSTLSSFVEFPVQVATLVAILKTARQMGLYQDLACVSVPGEGSVPIPEELLQRAVASSSESLQVDALQLACVHPKATSLPGKVPAYTAT